MIDDPLLGLLPVGDNIKLHHYNKLKTVKQPVLTANTDKEKADYYEIDLKVFKEFSLPIKALNKNLVD
jgi:hypothetical protein